jgi:hypothetical protein
MKKFTICTAVVGTLVTTALGLAGAAAAAPFGGASAAYVIDTLEDEGYNVQVNELNGIPKEPLSECTAHDVHGLSDSNIDSAGLRIDPTQSTTVYVDISCPDDA